MNTLEALATAKEAALKEVEAVEVKQKLADGACTDQYEKVIDVFFEGVFKESDEVVVSSYNRYRSVEVSVNRGEKYSEILRFSFRPFGFEDDSFEEISTGFYSTSTASEFELVRMITIGKVGDVLLNRGDEICLFLNEVKENHKANLAAIDKELSSAENNLREICEKEIKLRNEALMTKLETEGIEFGFSEENRRENTSFEIKFNWTLTNVTKVKLLNTTSSGKSARLEITRMTWGKDCNLVEVTFEETVRVDKLELFLRLNSKSMINN